MNIFDAIKNYDIQAVKQYIANNGDVNAKNDSGFTFLIWAAYKNYTDIVQLLINAKADVNAKDKDGGNTALILAVQNGYIETVQLLINAKADVNDKNKFGCIALIWAAKRDFPDIVQLLKNHEATE